MHPPIADMSLLVLQGVTETTLASSAVGASGLLTAGLPVSLTGVRRWMFVLLSCCI